ncbi:hypothetical protein ACI65C_004352 [Semiaphis heraclei]
MLNGLRNPFLLLNLSLNLFPNCLTIQLLGVESGNRQNREEIVGSESSSSDTEKPIEITVYVYTVDVWNVL